ncbi:unnamed protein product [Prorocentrum cordatum]|uniref:Fe2OG dioxygenase domain-containing protein n=1 Tax=Prorocentrum cordatum TaxID=2364126 RepID=A0ABN9RZE4_9DINO|nr:unnamed protein product [Polarella glacialis]
MSKTNAEVLATRTCGMPFLAPRKVVRQGYRRRPAQDGDADAAAAAREPCERRADAPWLGYAFVTFRDGAEAAEALALLDGRAAEGWTIRAQWAEEQHQGGPKKGRRLGARLAAGHDPPLGEQLFPAALHGAELAAALERHQRAAGVAVAPGSEPWVVAEAAKAFYRRHPRAETRVAGQPIPAALLLPLLAELRRTRWPPTHHRSGMQAEQYLVLFRGKRNDGFEALMELLAVLLEWADPAYGCNRIAVTKDFQGSPHIDGSDVTFQYAASLGDFEGGGELCVEGDQPEQVFVVDTRNRMARIDGRYVHWVRGYGGEERYSVIFFATNPGCATERTSPFHADFVPFGSPEERQARTRKRTFWR